MANSQPNLKFIRAVGQWKQARTSVSVFFSICPLPSHKSHLTHAINDRATRSAAVCMTKHLHFIKTENNTQSSKHDTKANTKNEYAN